MSRGEKFFNMAQKGSRMVSDILENIGEDSEDSEVDVEDESLAISFIESVTDLISEIKLMRRDLKKVLNAVEIHGALVEENTDALGDILEEE